MQPVSADRQLQTRGVSRRKSFGISQKNASWIKSILRDKIYTNKILAVLREYAANAWDANRMDGGAGADVPIKVVLPTDLEPFLLIRDFGPGLSEEDVFTVYTEYGESTKRTTNNAVGMLGIGSKSAFAYSDQFTITSWHKGKKAIYNATLTDSDDDMMKLGEWPSDEPSGIEIKVPVKIGDIYRFEEEAKHLFPYFSPPPEINCNLPKRDENARTHGFIEDRNLDPDGKQGNYYGNKGGRWIAIMGCIPYKVDLGQIKEGLDEQDLWTCLNRISGGLYLDIGDVEIAASREELEYTDHTKEVLIGKFRALIDEFIDDAIATLQSTTISSWEKRIRAVFLKSNLGLPIPARWTRWGAERVIVSEKQKVHKLDDKGQPTQKDGKDLFDEVKVTPEKFVLQSKDYNGIKSTAQIPVSRTMKVWVHDTKFHLTGYGCFSREHIVLVPNRGVSVEDALKEFNEWAKKLDFEGITTGNLSNEVYTPNANGRTPNRKHSVRSFKLKADGVYSNRGRQSDNWEIVDREPEDTDVFVILSHFKRNGSESFIDDIAADRKLAELLGMAYPNIYGYKTTERKPVKSADCTGTEWGEWRKGYWRNAVTSTHLRLISQYHWSRVIRTGWKSLDYFDAPKDNGPDLLAFIEKALGKDHEITKLVLNHLEGRKAVERGRMFHWDHRALQKAPTPKERQEANKLTEKWGVVASLTSRLSDSRRRPAAQVALDAVYDKYPLLRVMGDLSNFRNDDGKLWLDYIKMIDRCGGKK